MIRMRDRFSGWGVEGLCMLGVGGVLGTGDGGVTVGDCTSTSTSITLIDTSVYFEYPILPGGPFRNYPLTGFSLLLPLDPYDNYDPTVLICGGSQPINPSIPFVESEFNNALTSCGLIRPDQPNAQWEMDTMPTPRMLADLVHLPDGTILLLNGAKKGMAGWDLGRDPNFSAHLYIPNRPLGQRWHVLNNSTVPRLYHSVAQLLPDGRVMVAGSAPNSPTQLDYPKQFNNEYRVEYYHPHYLSSPFVQTFSHTLKVHGNTMSPTLSASTSPSPPLPPFALISFNRDLERIRRPFRRGLCGF
ncbi:hypothetical protein BC829DRAFT_148254 [Chytridium lagenaria]|nr:hypothetical protein BC829DRAFT_148254 [Chytridium lagenaria]